MAEGFFESADFYKEADSLWERLFDLQHDLAELLGEAGALLEDGPGPGAEGDALRSDIEKADDALRLLSEADRKLSDVREGVYGGRSRQ